MIYDSSDDAYDERLLHAKMTRIDRHRSQRIGWCLLLLSVAVLVALWLVVGFVPMLRITGCVFVLAPVIEWLRREK